MKVFRLSTMLPGTSLGPSVVTIGNFDGCHRGHQELIRVAHEQARQWQCPCAVLTFDPNPKQYFQPHRPFGKLFQDEQKIRALRELGIEILVVQTFDAAFSQLSPSAFYKSLLSATLQARMIVVGQNFRFGAQRQGDNKLLTELAAQHGAGVIVVPELHDRELIISSSAIRQLLLERQIERAKRLLNRPYLIEGRIESGQKIGRTLGFPTANLSSSEQLLPGTGVYAGFALLNHEASVFRIDPQAIPCVLNIGLRPTIDQQTMQPQVEVHLLEGQYARDGLYDQHLSVWLTDFIRDEQKFASLDALRFQIEKDCTTARQRLAGIRR